MQQNNTITVGEKNGKGEERFVLTASSFSQILQKIRAIEGVGQGYVGKAHAILGYVASTIYKEGWWRGRGYGAWKEFCEGEIKKSYPSVNTSMKDYEFFVEKRGVNLEEYMHLASRLGRGRTTALRLKSPTKLEIDMLGDEDISSLPSQPQELGKEDFKRFNFALPREQWESIEKLLEEVEKRANIPYNKKTTHVGQRIYNVCNYIWGIL